MARYEFSGRTEQHKAALKRLADARVLQQGGKWRGAMYLAGYVVECRLKARLMEIYNCRTLREAEQRLAEQFGVEVNLKAHSIEYLFGFTQARERLGEEQLRAFQRCNLWRTSWRYDPASGTQEQCELFMKAVDDFTRFVDSST